MRCSDLWLQAGESRRATRAEASLTSEDNPGNGVRQLKQLVFERVGIAAQDELIIEHTFDWRGPSAPATPVHRRTGAERSGRSGITAPGGSSSSTIPSIQIRPIRQGGSSRLESAGQRTGRRSLLVWLPSFFNQQAQKDLGRLVVLDHILTGARFDGYASRLSAIDRAQARTIVENQRSALKVRVGESLESAYGVRPDTGGVIDTTHQLDPEEQVQCLLPEVSLRPPAAANLVQALGAILDQALAAQFPAHPTFDADTKLGKTTLCRVWGELRKALGAADGRTMVEPGLRREVKPVVTALRLAQMSEAHLVIDDYWRVHFERKQAQNGGATPCVSVVAQMAQ